MDELKSKIEDLENRSMNKNLLFSGVPEILHENAEETIRDILYKMDLDDTMCLGRVRRLGLYKDTTTKSICVAFTYAKIYYLETTVITLRNEATYQKAEMDKLKAKIEDLENRSMNKNLLFSGVPEKLHENTEETIRDILYKMDLDDRMCLGPYKDITTRSI